MINCIQSRCFTLVCVLGLNLPLTDVALAQNTNETSPTNGLNRLNPEISATADLLLLFVPESHAHEEHGDEGTEEGHEEHAGEHDAGHAHGAAVGEGDHGFRFVPREVEIDIRANVDPFSSFRTTLGIDPHGIHLEEAWYEWVGLLPGFNIRVGRFRQNIGPINQRHLHAWDQMELPFIMKGLLGPAGLAQTGVGLHLLFGGFGDSAHTLTVEVTNSENEALYGDEAWRLPATLAHFATHIPFADSGYLELGLGAQHGYHHTEPNRFTNLYSADLTVAYDPPGSTDRFRMFLRGQWLAKHVQQEDDSLELEHGAYAYLDFRFNRQWQAGVRGDWLQKEDTFGVTPYVSFWQSEFFRLRLQYRATIEHESLNHLVALQVTGAIGPHRHEDY